MPLRERELREPVSLTRADGLLDPAAVGWARRPLVNTDGIDGRRLRGRNKRWEYWNIASSTHIVALTVSALDYAAVHEVWVYERATGRRWGLARTVLPARGVELPGSLGTGPARARARGLAIAIDEVPDGTRLRARALATPADGGPAVPVEVDVVAARPAGHECLAVVVPWTERLFQYTVKDVARPARGTVRIDGQVSPVDAGGDAWAVLDHGRGRWPYRVHWNWGAGSGVSGGHTIGIQVGGRWTDATGSTENAVLVDGRLHKISADLDWTYDRRDYLAPWRIRGGGLDVTFEPFFDKVTRTNLGVLANATDQCFGHYRGRFAPAGGEVVEFDSILGWAEDVRNRW